MKNILQMDDEEIKNMKQEIADEIASGEVGADDDQINPGQEQKPQGDENE